jgi:hypothetical protein
VGGSVYGAWKGKGNVGKLCNGGRESLRNGVSEQWTDLERGARLRVSHVRSSGKKKEGRRKGKQKKGMTARAMLRRLSFVSLFVLSPFSVVSLRTRTAVCGLF